ncbi:hypothetical protein EW026_g1768 [Hermanssonia centrifuga]|uniref:Carboxypeptidase n=1 Tax=Hermanssonia centrifuga TaxID=98765 RepID=A0A4S4KRA3_9APHY|nr:hypothetical protein EW026_g1768 [Hermanssonia centrifuga]
MAGESYGGRYIPVFASEVYDQNAKLQLLGMTPINLTSIMIGNGCTDDVSMTLSYYDMQCLPKSVPPIMDINTCVGIKQGLSRCEKWAQEECIDRFDAINCRAAVAFCEQLIMAPFDATGYNPYDISKLCVGQAFWLSMDSAFPTQYYIEALLERGIRTLLYIGANDWICNWVGNERMALGLEWTMQQEFIAQPLREWEIDGAAAGMVRNAGPLTFATLYGAGHMVPYDKPKESLELVKRWLAGKEI